MSAKIRGVAILVATLLAGLTLSHCSHLTGPPLTATVSPPQLLPSSTVANANSLCCCRARGTVKNTSTITAHVSLRFRAKTTQGADAGTAMDYVPSMAPGETRPYDASGFFVPCASIAAGTVTPDVLVVGLFESES